MSKLSIKSWFLITLGVLMLYPSILNAAAISIPDISAPSGSNISIPIESDDASGILSAFLVLSYDPEVLTAVDVSKAPLTSSFLIAHKMATGRITLSLTGAQPLSGGGVLAKVSFNVSQTAPVGSISELELTAAELNEGSIKVTPSGGLFTIVEGALITAPDTTATPGSSTSVPLTVSKGEGILSALIIVKYDATILTATGADLTPVTSDYSVATDVIPGQINVSIAGSTPLTESGALVHIHFSVSSSAKVGDASPLVLSKVILNEEAIFGNIINGSISLRAIRLPGDVTNNGEVTAYDAAHILQHTVGLLTLTGDDSVEGVKKWGDLG